MIDGLRPYPETRPTGLPWLPEVPAHWDVHRSKHSFREVDERSERGDEELLSVSHKTGVTPRSQKKITMFMAESYEGHKVCRPGDVVVNTMWAWMAAIGVSRHVGIVSPAYGVYRPRASARFEPRYLDYLLRTEAYRSEYLRSSRGITTSRLRLYPPDFLNIPFLQPSLDEQRLIVRFLDAHGATTARLIRAKQGLIKLLEEQKQAVVNRAVTRGLDPDARLKPSGVPWLGDVPAHWAVRKLREVAQVVNGYPFNAALFTTTVGHPLVRIRDLNKTRTEACYDGDFVQVAAVMPGEILIGMDGDFNVGTWNGDGPALLNQRMCCVRPSNPDIAAFLKYALSRPLKEINDVTWSTTVKHLSSGQVERICLAVPPTHECRLIESSLEHKLQSVDLIVAQAEREIALLREFRTRLTADVVTGRLDVRVAAGALPEWTVTDPVDTADEAEDLDVEVSEAEMEAAA